MIFLSRFDCIGGVVFRRKRKISKNSVEAAVAFEKYTGTPIYHFIPGSLTTLLAVLHFFVKVPVSG
jgi:hypothetical protein